MSSIAGSAVAFGRMIRLSHTIFSLPFALAAAAIASRHVSVSIAEVGAIVFCLAAARASAMGMNRIVDRRFDARNPRTADRELPKGTISVRTAWAFTLGSALLFVAGAAWLGPVTLALAPIALAVIWGYSLTKRFTSWCHLYLGLALSLAPTAAWVALTGSYGATAFLLSLAVGTWVAGFDIIYACQDAAFDRSEGLFSLPSRWGLRAALTISAALHVVAFASLAVLPMFEQLGWSYALGAAVMAGVLVYEHAIVSPTDLSRVDKAFFDLNGYVSVLFLATVLVSL